MNPVQPQAQEGAQMAVTALNKSGAVMPGDIGGMMKKMFGGMADNNAGGSPIPGLPPFLAKLGTMLGLPENMMKSMGEMFSKMSDSLKGPQMVASNNGGGMLAALRNTVGIEGPQAKSDLLVKGPGQVAPFTPGATPEVSPAVNGPTNRPAVAMAMSAPSGPQ